MPQTVTTIPPTQRRRLLNVKAQGAEHKELSSMVKRTRAIVDREIEKGETRLAAIIDNSLSDASEVYLMASRIGPVLMSHLEHHSAKALTLPKLEICTRIYERMLMCSRKVLRLDEASAGDSGVRVAIFLDTMRPSVAVSDAVGQVVEAETVTL